MMTQVCLSVSVSVSLCISLSLCLSVSLNKPLNDDAAIDKFIADAIAIAHTQVGQPFSLD